MVTSYTLIELVNDSAQQRAEAKGRWMTYSGSQRGSAAVLGAAAALASAQCLNHKLFLPPLRDFYSRRLDYSCFAEVMRGEHGRPHSALGSMQNEEEKQGSFASLAFSEGGSSQLPRAQISSEVTASTGGGLPHGSGENSLRGTVSQSQWLELTARDHFLLCGFKLTLKREI